MKSIVLVLIAGGILAGCAGTAKEETRDLYFKNREPPLVVPMRHPFPPSQGVVYLVSEQFFLCREKDFCPVPATEIYGALLLSGMAKAGPGRSDCEATCGLQEETFRDQGGDSPVR